MMVEPEIGKEIVIAGVPYECIEQGSRVLEECTLYQSTRNGCLVCGVLCNGYYRKDGKHIILKGISK